jgi:hypothetical protein
MAEARPEDAVVGHAAGTDRAMHALHGRVVGGAHQIQMPAVPRLAASIAGPAGPSRQEVRGAATSAMHAGRIADCQRGR